MSLYRKALPRHASRLALILALFALLSACVPAWPFAPPTPPPTSVPTARPTATVLPTATAEATAPPAGSPTAAPADLALSPDGVNLFPGPERYSGDIITLDVRPDHLGAIDPGTILVRVYRGSVDQDNVVATGPVDYYTFDGVPRARLAWAWDTAGLVGEQTLIAWVDPDDAIQAGDENPADNVVTLTMDLLPAGDLPPLEVEADWVSTTMPCCVLHYLDDTAAGRDIPTITLVTEQAVADIEVRLGVLPADPLQFYFIGRVIGHGGYAYDTVALSYLDRHYAGSDLPTVVRHEATHVVDGELLSIYPPAMLREGLATYMGGGHFKPEPIPQRTAALLELDLYVPLERLANNFYREQHEVGYMEAAGFIAFLVEIEGWDRFLTFYASFPEGSESGADQLDEALNSVYGQGLVATEQAFQAWLRALPPDPVQVRDLRDTVTLYDAVRRYQALKDPSAYWMNSFLPNPTYAEQHGLVADFLRHPDTPENIALETMLIAARERLRAEDFDGGGVLTAAVNRVLDTDDWTGAPEADYLAVVQAVAVAGYEAQSIDLVGDSARVLAIANWPELQPLVLQRTATGWGWLTK